MFLFILTVLCYKRHILDPNRSLFGPPVDENGKSPRYEFYGEYVVKSFSSDGSSSTQLGYLSPSSSAYLVSKEKTENDNFRIDYRLQVNSRTNAQMAFYGTKDSEVDTSRDFYGRNTSLNGFVFILDLNTSSSSLVTGAAAQDLSFEPVDRKVFQRPEKIDNFVNEDGNFVVRIEKEGTKVKFFIGRAANLLKFVMALEMTFDATDLHVGISAKNNPVHPTPVYLLGIRFYDLKFDYSHFNNEDLPRRGMGRLFWIGFFFIVVCIAYYLYQTYYKFGGRFNK